MAEPRAGQRIGEYVLEERLGAGGFAGVWRAAHHAFPERKVAAKLLHDPEQLALLRQEAECLARLEHPGVVGVRGVDLDHDPPYLLLELHEGETLRELLARGPLPPARAYRLFAQLTAALAHSHARGIAHGDLKPENVLVGADDALKLTDFGLGRVRASEASLLLSGDLRTQTQSEASLVGTLPYMAPEQREGSAPDPRSDVFALGVLLHELVTGKRPQPGDDPRHELQDPPGWLSVFGRCYARRDRRYADAGELLAALGVAERKGGGATVSDRLRLAPSVTTQGPWTVEELERAVASELGLKVADLLTPPEALSGVDRLIAWAEEKLTGAERERREARRLVWYLACELLDAPPHELADRYHVPAQRVREEVREVPKGGVRYDTWRAVVERLAPLPRGFLEQAKRAERGGLPTVGAFALFAMAVVAAVMTFVAGNPALLLLVPALAAAGMVALRVERRREKWVEAHLERVPGQDRREKLIALALHTELPAIAQAARRLLDAEEAGAPARALAGEPRAEAPPAPERASVEIEVEVAPVATEGAPEEGAAEVSPESAAARVAERRGASARSLEAVARALAEEAAALEALPPPEASSASEPEEAGREAPATGEAPRLEAPPLAPASPEAPEPGPAPSAPRPPIEEALRRSREAHERARELETG